MKFKYSTKKFISPVFNLKDHYFTCNTVILIYKSNTSCTAYVTSLEITLYVAIMLYSNSIESKTNKILLIIKKN